VWPAPLRFDPESVALRLGRATATPGPPPGAKDGSDPSVAV